MPRALIIGSSGQDGQYLFDLLSQEGYFVAGIDRAQVRLSSNDFQLDPIDICEAGQVNEIVQGLQPDEIYHLAAYHHSSQDEIPEDAAVFENSYQVHVLSLFNFLEAIRIYSPATKLFYAASSHIFGIPGAAPQDESTPINPHSLYAITKAAGLFLCRKYRHQHKLFASVGILYNHESPFRPEKFVSQRIVQGVLRIQHNLSDSLVLGDLKAEADWGLRPGLRRSHAPHVAPAAAGRFHRRHRHPPYGAGFCSHGLRTGRARLASPRPPARRPAQPAHPGSDRKPGQITPRHRVGTAGILQSDDRHHAPARRRQI